MSTSALLNALHSLALGRPAAFNLVATALHAALHREDAALLNDVLGQAALGEHVATLTAFDGMLNMFCTEPLTQTYADERQWRSYAVTAILRHPAGLVASCLGDMGPLEALLAGELGVASDRVKVDPLALPTWEVYNYGPLEAYHQCRASKVWAAGLLKEDPRKGAKNFWAGSEKVQRIEEAVFLVNVLCNVDEGPVILEKLQQAVLDQSAMLMLEAPVAEGPAVPVKVLLVDAGAAWTHFNEALHTADMYRVGGALRTVAKKHQLEMAGISLVAAYVEEDEDEHNTLRVSAVRKDTGALLAGMLFCDLHEPEHFMLRVDELLYQLRAAPIQRLESTFYDAEVTQAGDQAPRFFVPGSGWQVAADLV